MKPFAAEYKNLRSPLDPATPDQVTADGRTAMVEFDMRGTQKAAEKRIDKITAATGKIASRHPGFFVGEAGSISSGKALNDAFASQLAKAGERSVPLTLLVLLIVFGALVAAGIPLLLALSAVAATLGLVSIPSHLVPMDPNVAAVVLLVGLAVGVDYSLFYLKREREERASGKSSPGCARSGRRHLRAVGADLRPHGDGGDGRAAVRRRPDVPLVRDRDDDRRRGRDARLPDRPAGAALAARRQGREGQDPVPHRLRREGGENRFWSAVLTPVLRHPVVSVIASAGALLVLALPVLHIHTSQTGLDALPKSIATVPTIDRIQQSFPGGATPALVAIQAPADSPAVKEAVTQLEGEALATGLMTGPIAVDVSGDRTVTRVAIPLKGNGTDGDVAPRRCTTLRDTVLPATIGTLPGRHVRRHRRRRPPRPTRTACSSARRRSCSRSCSRSRSSCCSSRSARS